jgi:uncharacterized membrane protein
MLKKIIAYQKLLLNSMPPIDMNSKTSSEKIRFIFVALMMFVLNMFIFTGNKSSSNDIIPILFPVICVWMINRMLYSGHRLFETVPVSRKYIVLNTFLLPVVIIVILYVLAFIAGLVFAGILFGFLYLVAPEGFNQSPPASAMHQIIDTTKGNLLMLCILLIILFAGVAITFIKNKKLRFSSFAGFATIGYGLLFFLKFNMPISPNSDKVEFLESFSIMPEANTILFCVAIVGVVICISSVFMGYNLYVSKPNVSN